MTDWSHGYVADSPYTFAYQAAQAPGNLAQICAMMGVEWQPTARLTMADIGCGRGYTVNALAAANPGWTMLGLDYNPAHIAEAAALAESAELPNATFIEADLAGMTDAEIDQLPELDVASLHGVWTWVADPVRAGIVRLLSRRLKPGGLVYIGYNVMPGFGQDMALQRLLRHLAAQHRGSSPFRAGATIDAIRTLHESRPANLIATAMLKRLVDAENPLDPSYLAHEFLTEHWRPVFFEDLLADLAPAKLDYVGSVSLQENSPDYLFDEAQRAAYDAMPAGAPQEFIKDLCLGRPFRRDVFVRGLRRTDPERAMDRLVVAGCKLLGEESPRLGVQVGQAEIPAELWGPIAAALNDAPQSLGRLRHLTPGRHPNAAELLTVLAGTGCVLPALREAAGPTPATQRFNAAVAETYAAEGKRGGQYAMASPVAAAGLPCTWLELALSVQPESVQPEPELARIIGRILPDLTEEGFGQAHDTVGTMLRERLPVWRRFGIV